MLPRGSLKTTANFGRLIPFASTSLFWCILQVIKKLVQSVLGSKHTNASGVWQIWVFWVEIPIHKYISSLSSPLPSFLHLFFCFSSPSLYPASNSPLLSPYHGKTRLYILGMRQWTNQTCLRGAYTLHEGANRNNTGPEGNKCLETNRCW